MVNSKSVEEKLVELENEVPGPRGFLEDMWTAMKTPDPKPSIL